MVNKLRLPPRVKILEALGAVADGRVRLVGDGKAKVASSEGDREYTVVVVGRRVYSDDNGTKYRGYIGYPIIATLMLLGRIPYDEKAANALRGIRWRELNERYKRYDIVERIVKGVAEGRGVRPEELDRVVEGIFRSLRGLGLEYDESLGS